MGMYAIPFAVDILKAKNVFGCKDHDLFEKIKTADLYEHYANPDFFSGTEYAYNFDEILKDIIFNYVKPENRTAPEAKPTRNFWGFKKPSPTITSPSGLNKNMGHAYGYVLLVICDYLGEHLLPFCDGFYYGRDWEEAVSIIEAKGIQINLSDMFEVHQVFDIPQINDFPAIYCYSKKDINHINAVMDKVDIDEAKTDFDNDEFDEVQDMLKNIRESFKRCQAMDVEMIVFTH